MLVATQLNRSGERREFDGPVAQPYALLRNYKSTAHHGVPSEKESLVDICDLDYVIAGGGDTNTLIARRSTGRWRGIGAHACSHVECRAHYAIVIRSGGE